MFSTVVISLSKIKISKAIHNNNCCSLAHANVVISLSKIKISKAIHNHARKDRPFDKVVISLSKIKISKAIHNWMKRVGKDGISCHQSVKDKNFESNSQPKNSYNLATSSCHQSVKDKNFESNSQLIPICQN